MTLKTLNALILIITLAFPAGAQTPAQTGGRPLAGQPIESFEVTGNTSVARDTIRVYLGINPGDPYDPAAVQRNFSNLWQTGLFDDVRVEADQGQEGVILRAVVAERPRIGGVEYRGNKQLTADKIVEALDRAKIDLHIGNTLEQTLVRRAAEAIRTTYSEGGFEGVTVTSSLENMNDPNERRIVFQINEGIKARVAGIEFTGNSRFSDRRLRGAMKSVKKHNLYTWVRKKNVYTPTKFDEDLELVRNLYLDHGYKDVTFGDPQITTINGKKPRVRISVPVTEGVVHSFGEVSVSGNTVFTSEQLIGNWALKKGDVLRRKPIQARADIFQEGYARRGHIYAFIDVEYIERENNVVDVELKVFEGDQFKLGRLEFTGNTTTKDKVLRREIFLEEGETMDMETFKASIFKLGQLGFFKVTENPDFRVNSESKTVDITVKGQEEGRNDIQFGGGYSEAYGFFGQFQFSTRNFMGEGESIGVSYQRGRSQDYFSLSYSDPWFMDRPHSFGVSVYDRATVLPDSVGFERSSQGGTVAYGYRVGRFEGINFLYGFEQTDEHSEFTPTPDEEGNVPLPQVSDLDYTTSLVVPSYRYDSRDNPFDTTRGARGSLSLYYAGGPLGGTINLFKPELNATYFKKLTRKSTLSFNTEIGQIFAQDKNCAHFFANLAEFDNKLCVPRSERFYAGGEQSVRGFRSYSLGPKEMIDGVERTVGGYKKLIVNTEWVFKINEPLRFVLFADAGQAYGYNEDWDLSRLRYAAGAEMRMFLPVFQFPLRFIYAWNPDPQPNDDFQTFQFSIGNTF